MSTSNPVSFAATLHVRDHCLCLHTQRAARHLSRRFDAALRPAGLTSGQFSLMMGLNRPIPAGMRALATLLAMDRTTLTAALKPLERRGLIAMTADPDDARRRLLTLTASGAAMLATALPIWTDAHTKIDAILAQESGSQVRRILRALELC